MINLHSLSDFDINTLTMKAELAGQRIEFHPQRTQQDVLIPDLKDSQCYYCTSLGSEQSFNYITSDTQSLILKHKINIAFDDNTWHKNGFTLTCAKHPEIAPIHFDGEVSKALCFMAIMVYDRQRNNYTAEEL